MTMTHDTIRAVMWEDNALHLLDQRVLPATETYLVYRDAAGVAQAIRDMVVRGAPAIGITAAFGVVLAARSAYAQAGADWKAALAADFGLLAEARPTAVNLAWALERMGRLIDTLPEAVDPEAALLVEARAIHEEDIAANRHMGRFGADLIAADGGAVLTHCNTGSLATGGFGTALGVIRQAFMDRRISRIYADETRPWLQGARLTAWELVKDAIPVTLLADGAAAALMAQGRVSWVIVGSDRISANGDVANKIGTYSLAIAARHHGVKFMVVAPTSTVDMQLPSGDRIPIETRAAEEVLGVFGTRVAAEGAEAWNPAFDVTPAGLIDAIVTEKGVVERPDAAKMRAMMES